MVDFDVVVEALEKGKAQLSPNEEVDGKSPEDELFSIDADGFPNSIMLRREATYEKLSWITKIKYWATTFVYGKFVRYFILWLILFDLLLISIFFLDEVEDKYNFRISLLSVRIIIAIIFLVEKLLKISLGIKDDPEIRPIGLAFIVDFGIVVANFILVLIQLIDLDLQLYVFEIIIAVRLLNSIQISPQHKVFLEYHEERFASHLDEVGASLFPLGEDSRVNGDKETSSRAKDVNDVVVRKISVRQEDF